MLESVIFWIAWGRLFQALGPALEKNSEQQENQCTKTQEITIIAKQLKKTKCNKLIQTSFFSLSSFLAFFFSAFKRSFSWHIATYNTQQIHLWLELNIHLTHNTSFQLHWYWQPLTRTKGNTKTTSGNLKQNDLSYEEHTKTQTLKQQPITTPCPEKKVPLYFCL